LGMTMITYRRIYHLAPELFIDILERSTMDERRPMDNFACIKAMAENASLIIGS